jgi:hypothetical protein
MRDQPIARPLPIHRTTHAQNKRTKTFMHRVGFELTTPVFERAKTALDGAATVISKTTYCIHIKCNSEIIFSFLQFRQLFTSSWNQRMRHSGKFSGQLVAYRWFIPNHMSWCIWDIKLGSSHSFPAFRKWFRRIKARKWLRCVNATNRSSSERLRALHSYTEETLHIHVPDAVLWRRKLQYNVQIMWHFGTLDFLTISMQKYTLRTTVGMMCLQSVT